MLFTIQELPCPPDYPSHPFPAAVFRSPPPTHESKIGIFPSLEEHVLTLTLLAMHQCRSAMMLKGYSGSHHAACWNRATSKQQPYTADR